jgi:hypothetical protein
MARKRARRPGSSRPKIPSGGARTSRLATTSYRKAIQSRKLSPKVRERAFAAAAAVRRGESKLRTALKQQDIKLSEFKQFRQLWYRDKRGRTQVTKNDTYSRSVNVYIPLRLKDGDVRAVKVHGYSACLNTAFASPKLDTLLLGDKVTFEMAGRADWCT